MRPTSRRTAKGLPAPWKRWKRGHGEATVCRKDARNLPASEAVAFAAGFLLTGGIGATMRLLPRGAKGESKASAGRFPWQRD